MLEEHVNKERKIVVNELGSISVFTGTVLGVEDGFLTIRDKFNRIISVNVTSIIKVEEVR